MREYMWMCWWFHLLFPPLLHRISADLCNESSINDQWLQLCQFTVKMSKSSVKTYTSVLLYCWILQLYIWLFFCLFVFCSVFSFKKGFQGLFSSFTLVYTFLKVFVGLMTEIMVLSQNVIIFFLLTILNQINIETKFLLALFYFRFYIKFTFLVYFKQFELILYMHHFKYKFIDFLLLFTQFFIDFNYLPPLFLQQDHPVWINRTAAGAQYEGLRGLHFCLCN